jgi:hypothetical protein
MGLLDLPAPLLDWLDAALSNVITAPGLRLALWGAVGAVLSMALYWALSPQERIARIKAEALAARQRLDSYEGALGDAWPMIGGMLKLVLAPACDRDLAGRARLSAGALPDRLGEHGLRSLVPRRGSAGRGAGFSRAIRRVWVNGYDPQPGQKTGPAHIQIADAEGRAIGELELAAPVSTVHKREWWNALIGNPTGYLPEAWPVERIEIDLPCTEYLPFGPWWLRSWEAVFFGTLLACSVAIKVVFRIQ